jgi:hypothetical protein
VTLVVKAKPSSAQSSGSFNAGVLVALIRFQAF